MRRLDQKLWGDLVVSPKKDSFFELDNFPNTCYDEALQFLKQLFSADAYLKSDSMTSLAIYLTYLLM